MEEWYEKVVAVETKKYSGLATYCLICEESVAVYSIHDAPKICDKCKAVVLKLREQEEQPEKWDNVNSDL